MPDGWDKEAFVAENRFRYSNVSEFFPLVRKQRLHIMFPGVNGKFVIFS